MPSPWPQGCFTALPLSPAPPVSPKTLRDCCWPGFLAAPARIWLCRNLEASFAPGLPVAALAPRMCWLSCGPTSGFTLTLRLTGRRWHCWEDPRSMAALAAHLVSVEEERDEKEAGGAERSAALCRANLLESRARNSSNDRNKPMKQ